MIAEAAEPMYTFDPVPKKRVYLFDQAAAALADVEHLPTGQENEIWYQGSETPRSGRRVTRVVGQAARGALEHASSPPLSSTLCALRVVAFP